jgi:hypothetical protein
MDEQELDRMLPGWRALSDAVGRELIVWREAHPRASLTQIEDAVFEAMQRLQARALQQVVLASAVASPTTSTTGGGPQLRRVHRMRSRSFFPLDEELELLPGELSATRLQKGRLDWGQRCPSNRHPRNSEC